ncbi:MAG: EamA family transporter [Bryobacterales bacterium]|nr:EamA family transporter [Bryobacterales bacterium]
MALESFPPMMLVSARFLISGSILLAVVKARGGQLPSGDALRKTAFAGVLILGLGNAALTVSELFIASGMAGLMITISPFWMISLEAALPGGQRLHGPTVAGMVVGLLGALVLLAPDLTGQSLDRSLLRGFLILQVGMAAWSFGSIYQRRQAVGGHALAVGAIHQLAAGIAFLPIAALVPAHPVEWSVRGVGAMIYLIVFGSIIGYTSYTYVLERLPVAVVSIHSYLNCVVAVVLGWLVYREPFGWREGSAMGIIFLGVAIVKSQSLRGSRDA